MDALEYLNERIEAIQDVRKAEQGSNYRRMKLGCRIMGRILEVTPEAQKSKRAAADANNAAVEGAIMKKRVKCTVLDE